MLKQPAARPAAPGEARGGAAAQALPGVVFDVAEADFQQLVLERSTQVPVMVYLWAERDGQTARFGPVLEALAAEFNGGFVLARWTRWPISSLRWRCGWTRCPRSR